MTSAAIRPRAEERWQGPGLSTRRLPATMGLIAIASLAGHLAIVAGAAFDTKPPPPPTQDISVEIVQEMPKPVEKASAPAKVAEAPPKAEASPKVEPAKIEPAKLETTKPEPPKPEPAKQEAAKQEPAKQEPVKPAPVKAEQPKPAAPPPQTAAEDAAKDAAKEQKLAELQKELESLKAEQTQLQAERTAEAAAEAQQQQPAQMRDTGLGPLPESFQAVALPAAADGQGEATSYQEIVFSALAKAKGIGATKGLPGTAGVHFTLDARGEIVDLALVHKSGVAALDAEALDIVRRAGPFPVPPQGAQRVFDANFTFKTQAAQ